MSREAITTFDFERCLYNQELIGELQNLTEIPSVSGNEQRYGIFLKEMLQQYSKDVYIDSVGNVIAKKGDPEMYIFTHMDTIGFLVSSKNDKGVSVVSVKAKGARPTDEPWKIQILSNSGEIAGDLYKSKDNELLNIDLTKNKLKKVNVGDFISLVPNMKNIDSDVIASQGLDNRLGILTAIEVFKKLPDIGLVVTVQEETTGIGASKAAYDLKPQEVIVLDTTYDESEQGIMGPKIGNGPAICLKDSIFPDKVLVEKMVNSAMKTKIPYQFEVLESGSSDANRIQNVGGYTPLIFLGIPIKNMHSPNEIANINDVVYATTLLTTMNS